MAKKSKQPEWADPVVPAYLPPEPVVDPASERAFGSMADAPAEPLSLGTDVSPAPFGDEAVWDGQHWTHGGRVWDGSAWVFSPELLADRRAQSTQRFEASSVRVLKSIAYALLSLLALTFAAASVVLPRMKNHEEIAFGALSVAGLLAIVSLVYLWRRRS